MKVLHINNYDYKGGAETVFRATFDNPLNTHNYTGFVTTKDTVNQPDIIFKTYENNGKILGIFNYIFSIKNYLSLKRFLEKESIDIIHIHGFYASISPSILLALKKYKRVKGFKIIQTLHDFHPVCPNASLYNYSQNNLCEKCVGRFFKLNIFWNNCDRRGVFFSMIKGIRSLIANVILKHLSLIDLFICPSNFMKDIMIKEGISGKKLRVIRNPIDERIETPLYTPKNNIICYFGRFSKEKNLQFLIAAFIKWKELTGNDFKLILIGEGEEKDHLIKIAAESSYGKDILFMDFLPNNLLIEAIKNAKYFSMSSLCYENAPMSIIESYQMDILSIVPDLGGMSESIKILPYCGITYKPGNIDSWIDAVTFLENNYDSMFKNMNLAKFSTQLQNIKEYLKNVAIAYKNIRPI